MAEGRFKGNPGKYRRGTATVKRGDGVEYERAQYRVRGATTDADARFDRKTAVPQQPAAEPALTEQVGVSMYVAPHYDGPLNMVAVLEAHHGPDVADAYEAYRAGAWDGDDERLRDILALADTYEKRAAEGRDLLTGRDAEGFDEWGVDVAGFRRDGTSAFGFALEHERTLKLLDGRGFKQSGEYMDSGRYRNPLGTDAKGFCPPEDGSGLWPAGTCLNLLTKSPFTPPPHPKDINGWDRHGRRRGRNGVIEVHPTHPLPYFI